MFHRTSGLLLACALGAVACAPGAPVALPATPQNTPGPADTRPGASDGALLPVAVSGGTLLVSRDGATALVADPDQDRVFLVDIDQQRARASASLRVGDEPGRSVEDGKGRFHVVLRGGNAVATLDPVTGTVQRRTPVCSAPRGILYDSARDELLVACMSGQVARLDPSGERPPVLVTVAAARDLRDLVKIGDQLYVSRFRSAELLKLDSNLQPTQTFKLPRRRLDEPTLSGTLVAHTVSPAVAWRTLGLPDQRVLLLHQTGVDDVLTFTTGASGRSPGYGAPPKAERSGSIVRPAMTVLDPRDGSLRTVPFSHSSLVVDAALSPDGKEIAVVSAGNGPDNGSDALTRIPLATLDAAGLVPPGGTLAKLDVFVTPASVGESAHSGIKEDAVAVAYGKRGLMVLLRDPVALRFADGARIDIGRGISHAGHSAYHKSTPFFIACASCHPEGTEDSRLWSFSGLPPLRTPSSRGGLMATAPFHWTGDMANFAMLAREVLGTRMGGNLSATNELGQWVDTLPAIRMPSLVKDEDAVSRGKRLFEDETVGCAKCHNGPLFTNNKTEDVGTGGAFQVPQLTGLASRAPFMHSGCATTLRGRFDAKCGGGDKHGTTSQLTDGQLDDLVAFLETL